MSEYDEVVRNPLKLKVDSSTKKKKKKKSSEAKVAAQITTAETEQATQSKNYIQRTKAELAFLKQQEKMQEERIKRKAEKTHKQRVEDFNRHLDSLTEHFDIPKVSWTK